MEQRAVSLPSMSLAIDTTSLTQYFLETLISSGIPAIFWIVVIGFAAKSIKNAKDAGNSEGPNGGLFGRTAVTELYDDLYGPSGGGQKSLLSFGRGVQKTIPKNIGIPTDQFLKITKLNSKYESFEYSLTAATQSKAKAAAKYRSRDEATDRMLRELGEIATRLGRVRRQGLKRLQHDGGDEFVSKRRTLAVEYVGSTERAWWVGASRPSVRPTFCLR